MLPFYYQGLCFLYKYIATDGEVREYNTIKLILNATQISLQNVTDEAIKQINPIGMVCVLDFHGKYTRQARDDIEAAL